MILLNVFLVVLCVGACLGYDSNRTALREKYPGYGTDWVYFHNGKGKLVKGYLRMNKYQKGPFPVFDVNTDVVFRIHTWRNKKGQIVNLDSKSLKGSEYDPKKKVKIFIHGWFTNSEGEFAANGTNQYLSAFDYNVFTVDWGKIAEHAFYPIPLRYTPKIGEHLGRLIKILISAGSNRNEIHLIGHSLGAHIASFAAKSLKGFKIGRITGLDPALPGFTFAKNDARLTKTDASFVDVIHTCVYLGIGNPIGHADFYPNGGILQPGCERTLPIGESCSHSRSWALFHESITTKEFVGYLCNSYEDLRKDECEDEEAVMGEWAPITARGTFYLRTSAKFPFSDVPDDDFYEEK